MAMECDAERYGCGIRLAMPFCITRKAFVNWIYVKQTVFKIALLLDVDRLVSSASSLRW